MKPYWEEAKTAITEIIMQYRYVNHITPDIIAYHILDKLEELEAKALRSKNNKKK